MFILKTKFLKVSDFNAAWRQPNPCVAVDVDGRRHELHASEQKKKKTRQQFVAAEEELNLDATNERQKQININNN